MDDIQPPVPPEPAVEPVSEGAPVPPPAPCPDCDTYLAGWKRAQADYQNLKRDMERAQAEQAKYANERLLRGLLPAIDQFRLALSFVPPVESLPETERASWEKWLVGVRAVRSLWDQMAAQNGLEPIPAEGPFDPQWHEAVAEEPSELPEGSVVRVVQPGWRLHGRVLEPARVIVAKAP